MNASPMPDLRIAAVFATMNRSATAEACVRALAAQTRPPELVVVADNVSTDETPARLMALADLPFPLRIHRMAHNRGNAGGVEEAMDLAFSLGMDAVWILDDDSWPRPDALELLLRDDWNPRVVRHPLQIDPKSGKLTWPLQVWSGDDGFVLIDDPERLPDRDVFRTRITWTGALVSREVREAIGPVIGDLFIRGEDEEYPLRMEQAGFHQEAVRRSVLDHPGPARVVRWGFLGRSLFHEPGLADWKLYYKVRNRVWLKRRESGTLGALAMTAGQIAVVCRIDGIRRLPLLVGAAWDGWRGKLGIWNKHPTPHSSGAANRPA